MEEKKAANRLLIPALLGLIVLLLVVILVFVLRGNGTVDEGPVATTNSDGSPILGYASGTTVVDDENALQAAVDKMVEDASKEMVASFKPAAVSEDGINFTCYIANSEYNEYDMFIALYENLSDEEDPLFLSGLMRPGEAFREITLTRSLEKGTRDVYLVFTQVEDDHSTLHGQSIVSLQMQVN